MSKSRNWVFTLNNPEWSDVTTLTTASHSKFIIAVMEKGVNGTPHYQGYLELSTPRALSTLKTINGRAHWALRRGSRAQAIQYTMKTLDLEQIATVSCGTRFAEESITIGTDGQEVLDLPKWIVTGYNGTFGELASSLQKKDKTSLRERLTQIQEKIQAGVNETEIAQDHFTEWCRYRSSFQAYRLLHSERRNFKTEVTVIQGPTGTGKSMYCEENFPDAYWKGRDAWWDGYQQQEYVILDEYYGWLPYDFLLRLTDRYPLDVEVKGGKVNFASKKIIITTNKRPDLWYQHVYFPAFCRRVEEWLVFGTCFRSRYKKFSDAKFIEIHSEDQSGDVDNDFNRLSIE